MFLLKYLGLIHVYYFSEGAVLWLPFYVNNGTLKVQVSSFPSYCINNYLTPLLLRTHPRQSYFRYGIDEVLYL